MRAILYRRCSTREQARSGLGLAHQEAALKAEATRRGWEVMESIVDEGESAKTLDRPGLYRALEMLANGDADVLVATKLDRLSRSVLDFQRLLGWFEASRTATLVVLDIGLDTSSPGGRLVANVMASVAEWERSMLRERTSDALRAKRSRGEKLAPSVLDRPKVVEQIKDMRAAGKSLRAIADHLNATGVPTARGADKWHASAVQVAAGYERPEASPKDANLPDPRPKRRATKSTTTVGKTK